MPDRPGVRRPARFGERNQQCAAASQVVRILTSDPEDKNRKSKPLVEHEFALMKILSENRLYAIRLFVHLPEESGELRGKIDTFFKSELPEFPFSS
jgi:hypothetical protein